MVDADDTMESRGLPAASYSAISELVAKQDIYEVLCRYCRGIDRLDLELVRDCYHPDATDHHVSFEGQRDEFIEWLSIELRKLDGTMHTIGNHLIELQGELARSETYVHTSTWTRSSDGSGDSYSITGTRYVDTFECRGGVWRIAERWAVRSWARSNGVYIGPISVESPIARRDRDDLVYKPLPGR